MALKKDPIFGYVDLTKNFRKWLKDQYLNKGQKQFAAGWRVIPAHHRTNPTHDIIMKGYPDVENSHLYWFDNPDKRDENNEIVRLPLPIHAKRDKEHFREENAKMKSMLGFDRYMILESRRNLISEYVPEKGFGQVTAARNADVLEATVETPAHVAHPGGGFSDEVLDQAAEIVAKNNKTKKPKTETRLQTA